MEQENDSEPKPVSVLVDEKEQKQVAASSGGDVPPRVDAPSPPAATSPSPKPTHLSPPSSPPASPPSPDKRMSPGADDYYSTRPKYDKLGNPIPQRRPGAMSTVYGSSKIRLPGDLGPNDPRRPKSPVPASLPGDLGPNDPRRPRSTNSSPAPAHHRHASDASEAPEEGARVMKDPKVESPREEEPHESDEDADADNDNLTDTSTVNDEQDTDAADEPPPGPDPRTSELASQRRASLLRLVALLAACWFSVGSH